MKKSVRKLSDNFKTQTMKLLNKVLFFLLISAGSFYKAQTEPPPPMAESGVGPGAPASPIDMYVYVLAAAAMLFMCYYHYKTRKKIV